MRISLGYAYLTCKYVSYLYMRFFYLYMRIQLTCVCVPYLYMFILLIYVYLTCICVNRSKSLAHIKAVGSEQDVYGVSHRGLQSRWN